MSASPIVMTIRPARIRASASPAGDRKPDRRSWWAPVFGWSAEPDYIDGGGSAPAAAEEERRPARRFGAFTEEKARELRMKAMETDTFHDAMYHSAIASRLASDVGRRRAGGGQ